MKNHSQESDDITGFLLIPILIIVGSLIITTQYNNYKYEINSGLIHIINIQLKVAGIFSPKAEMIRQKILFQKSPDEFSIEQIIAQLNYAGKYSLWVVIPLMLFLCAFNVLKFGKITRMNRTFNMWSLLQELAKTNYELAPIANRGKSILDEPYDTGPWRTVRTPLQFAIENNLIRSKTTENIPRNIFIDEETGLLHKNLGDLKKKYHFYLDTEQSKIIFEKQLGEKLKKFSVIQDLQEYQKALAIAFMAFAEGEKQMSEDILKQAAISYKEKPAKLNFLKKIPIFNKLRAVKESKPTFSVSIPGIEKHVKDFKWEIDELKIHSEYVHTFIIALYLMAKRKGIITTAQFIWLRTIDRPLFYALHHSGRLPDEQYYFDSKWIEASAIESHYVAEDKDKNAIETPQIKAAIDGLEMALKQANII